MAIEPIEQKARAHMPGAAPCTVFKQGNPGLASHPLGDIDHPVGTVVPRGERIGAPHQCINLGRVIQTMFTIVRTAAEPAPDGTDSEEENFHRDGRFSKKKGLFMSCGAIPHGGRHKTLAYYFSLILEFILFMIGQKYATRHTL